jgi:hypothetical protein
MLPMSATAHARNVETLYNRNSHCLSRDTECGSEILSSEGGNHIKSLPSLK